tara:strand:+ start:1153 stop:1539 length:387 start_codon:yes stop_codon:yes gene_type:complete
VVEQVTRGIKISIIVDFKGSFLKNKIIHYAFAYRIEIKNQSKDSVKLLTRSWKIIEANKNPYYIEGNGVVGERPVIFSGKKFKYESGCLITSAIGGMKGFFTMVNFTTTKNFNVEIPLFKLNADFILN